MISLNDLMSPMNGLVAALLRSPLHGIASRHLMLVEWSGRRSGCSYSIPVGYQPAGDALVVMLSKREEKSWWKNFRSPWPATLLIRGERRSALGEVVPVGSVEFYEHCVQTLRRLPWMGSQFGGVTLDPATGLDDAGHAVLAKHVGAVRFDLLD